MGRVVGKRLIGIHEHGESRGVRAVVHMAKNLGQDLPDRGPSARTEAGTRYDFDGGSTKKFNEDSEGSSSASDSARKATFILLGRNAA
jgi:hypothetical protein